MRLLGPRDEYVLCRSELIWDCSCPVLQAIRLRYAQKEIYTYSGIVLIATNPFARVDPLYVPGMVQVYAGKQRATQAPHLFAIAEEAFMYGSAPSPRNRRSG